MVAAGYFLSLRLRSGSMTEMKFVLRQSLPCLQAKKRDSLKLFNHRQHIPKMELAAKKNKLGCDLDHIESHTQLLEDGNNIFLTSLLSDELT
jgi:hypothetical protein